MRKVCSSIFVFLFIVSCRSGPRPEEINALTEKLNSAQPPAFVRTDKESLERWKVVRGLYEGRDFHPIWIVRGRPQRGVEELKLALNQASLHGLNAALYDTAPSSDPLEHELRLSWALVNFGIDVAGKDAPVQEVIAQAINDKALSSLADNLAPKHAEYQGLQRALQTYRQSAPGSREVHLIELNMDRLRDLPSDRGRRHIVVNIPEYKLRAVEDGREVLTMSVIVGKEETPTPSFSADMTHVVFSPYWNIPESILTNETLPKAFADANYLARQNIEIVRVNGGQREVVDASEIDWSDITARSGYHFRQKPGASNSLGLVKFMLPNKFDVYLHDTPADNLFKVAERDFSHGCVRLERPLDLATYVLHGESQWPEEKIKAAMHSGDETTAKLDEAIPVHIIYITAWPKPDGSVEFLKDIYNLDEAPNA